MAPHARVKRGTTLPERGGRKNRSATDAGGDLKETRTRIQKSATPPVDSKSSRQTSRKSKTETPPPQSLQQDSIYRPLDKERKEIRLLILEPGSGRSPVRGNLEYAFLSDDPKPIYETISYVWGDASMQATIYLNHSRLKVPATAKRVLQRMRHADKTRALWIDSVCINQADVAERGHQVGMMDEVYSNTFQNLIWLGEDDGLTVSALDTIQKIIAEVRHITDDYKTLRSKLFAEGGGNRPPSCGLSFEPDIKALESLFGSPWFSRLWIIQEVCLSPSNLCYRGDVELPFEDLLVASAWLRHKSRFFLVYPYCIIRYGPHIFDLQNKQYGSYAPYANCSMSDIVSDLRDFKAQDPRDHFYALFGLLKIRLSAEQASWLPVPDYTLSPSEVFQQAAEVILRDTGDLKILNYALCNRARSRRYDGDAVFPSWMPRWDFAHKFSQGDSIYLWSPTRADNHVQPEALSIEHPEGILIANGIVVDKIDTTVLFPKEGQADTYCAFFDEAEKLSAVDEKEDILQIEKRVATILTSSRTQPTGEPGVDPSLAPEVDTAEAYSMFKKWIKETNSWPRRDSSLSPHDTLNVVARFFEDLCAACGNRAFFRTATNHYPGVGNDESRCGDIIAVLWGCMLPVILRPLETGADEYEFLGICYVDGIMDGEAVRAHRARGEEDVRFRLR